MRHPIFWFALVMMVLSLMTHGTEAAFVFLIAAGFIGAAEIHDKEREARKRELGRKR